MAAISSRKVRPQAFMRSLWYRTLPSDVSGIWPASTMSHLPGAIGLDAAPRRLPSQQSTFPWVKPCDLLVGSCASCHKPPCAWPWASLSEAFASKLPCRSSGGCGGHLAAQKVHCHQNHNHWHEHLAESKLRVPYPWVGVAGAAGPSVQQALRVAPCQLLPRPLHHPHSHSHRLVSAAALQVQRHVHHTEHVESPHQRKPLVPAAGHCLGLWQHPRVQSASTSEPYRQEWQSHVLQFQRQSPKLASMIRAAKMPAWTGKNVWIR